MIKIFRKLDKNEQLVIGADPSEGGDPCCAQGISKKHADIPIVLHEVNMGTTQFGYELDKLGRYIQQETDIYPTIGVERNVGAATISRLIELNYPTLFKMRQFDVYLSKEVTAVGWSTNLKTRPKMLDDLALSVRQRVIKIYDKDTVEEMQAFVKNPKKGGKAEAQTGADDDRVMALAIGWQLYQLVSSALKKYRMEPFVKEEVW